MNSPDAERPTTVVLVVEDEKSLLEITTLRLRELNCRVIGAGDPEEALTKYDEHQAEIDFVFTDLRMGGMGGQGLIEHLIARRPEVKIVATSALLDELDSLRGKWGNRVRMLLKPYSVEELKVLLAVEGAV